MSTELILYTNPQSRGNVVNWMLEEVGAPYRMEVVTYGPEMKSPEYLAINPMGKVPALKHGDVVVTELAAILCYLADAFPEAGLAPDINKRDERAAYYRWMFFVSNCLEPAITNHTMGWTPDPEQQAHLGYGSLDLVLNTLTDAVRDRRYLVGDHFTAADLFVGAYLDFFMRFDTIEKRPEFVAYCEHLNRREAAVRALEKTSALAKEQGLDIPS